MKKRTVLTGTLLLACLLGGCGAQAQDGAVADTGEDNTLIVFNYGD